MPDPLLDRDIWSVIQDARNSINNTTGVADQRSAALAQFYDSNFRRIVDSARLVWIEPNASTPPGFILPRLNGPQQFPISQPSFADLAALPSALLMQGLKITDAAFQTSSATPTAAEVVAVDQANQGAQAAAGVVLDMLQNRITNDGDGTELQEIAAAADNKLASDVSMFGDGFSPGEFSESEFSDAEGSVLRELGGNLASSGESNRRNRRLDGRRVSREPHEYRYCLESRQIENIYTSLGQYLNGDLITDETRQIYDRIAQARDFDSARALLEEDGFNTFSFGNFVDARAFRRTIAEFRSLRRFAFAANVLAIARVLGTTRENILRDLQQAFWHNSALPNSGQTLGRFCVGDMAAVSSDQGVADFQG